MTTFAQDTMAGRTVSGSFGAASDGINTWQTPNLNTGAIVNVGSNEATIYYDNLGAGAGTYATNLGLGAVRDVNLSMRFSFLTAFTGTTSISLVARYRDANNWYRATFVGSHLFFSKRVTGTTTNTSVAAFTLTASTYYNLRFQVNGSALSATIWQDGTSEPAPQWSGTDTSLTLPGAYGIVAIATGTSAGAGINIDSFLAQSVSSQLAAIYVNGATGNDSNAGTLASPVASIQQGLNLAAPGSIVHVAPVVSSANLIMYASGTGGATVPLTFPQSSAPSTRIVVQSDVQSGAAIRAPGAVFPIDVKGSYIDFLGLEVGGDSLANMGIHWTGPGVSVQRCYVHDIQSPNATYPSGGGGIVGQGQLASNALVHACLITNTGTSDDLPNTVVQPIYVQSDHCAVKNNIIAGSYASGITAGHYANVITITNNAILNTYLGVQIGGIDGGTICDNSVVANNIFDWYGSLYQGGGASVFGTYIVAREQNNTGLNNIYANNVVWGPTTGTAVGSGGHGVGWEYILQNGLNAVNTINADPQFVNYQGDGTGDYHLQGSSPCIDAGTSTGAPATDFDGIARPQGAGYDIGPYEALVFFWTVDILNSRVVASANQNALAIANSVNAANVRVQAVTNQSYLGGLVARFSNKANYYSLLACDSSGQYPNTMRLSVMAGGTETLLASQPIVFPRGTYHILMFTIIGTTLLGYFDGKRIIYVIDSTLIGSGLTGLYHGGGASGTTNWYDFGTRALGGDATGKNVYTKVRMTSTDPLVTPRLTDLVASVRSPDIATGNSIPQTQYSYKNTIAASLDDAAKQSDLSWRFDELYKLKMTDRLGQIAPFVIATANQNIDGPSSPKVTRGSPAYRNRQYITGAVDLQVISESKVGDGITQSWPLKYPVDQLLSVTVNGQPQSFGIQGTDTGRMFYYQAGQNTLSLDSSATPPAGSFSVTYIGRVPYRAMKEDLAQQAILAALDGSTGIVEATEDVQGLSAAAADALAQARLDQNARLAVDWSFTTRQSGLDPGQLLPVVVPEHGLNDFQFLITGISTTVKQDKDGNLLYWHTVSTTTGPSTGNWARRLQVALLKKG